MFLNNTKLLNPNKVGDTFLNGAKARDGNSFSSRNGKEIMLFLHGVGVTLFSYLPQTII